MSAPFPLPDTAIELLALSNREREIFVRLARGEALQGIARAMGLSPSTISTYRCRITAKTGITNEADMAHYAIARGLVALKYLPFPVIDASSDLERKDP